MPQPARVLVTLLTILAMGCGEDRVSHPDTAALAAHGQSAFYDTLFGIADRNEEAVTLLQSTVAQNPTDGRSQFLLGMLHMLRYGRAVTDAHNAGAALTQEVRQAQAALDAAVPLLPEDRRVPGFRAAATYTYGVVTHDAARTALGLSQLRDAIALFPEFNTFDFIGTVAPIVLPSDPLYQEAITYVGDPLNSGCSPFTQPEICGNSGKAPHNIEGSLVLFGDLFAKAGNAAKARTFYRLALTPFSTTGGPWSFRGLAEERMQSVAQRVVLYQDDDPGNDPKLIGYGQEACAVCHYQ